ICKVWKFIIREFPSCKAFVLNEAVIGCPINIPGAKDMMETSKEQTRSRIFVQTVEELVPSLTKSCIRRMKNLMES
ncbi:hypothetical protein GW17_00048588, partial [Ensete ventricosum]